METIYPPQGVYRLVLEDGREITRPMSPGWEWDETWNGARIQDAYDETNKLVWSR